MNHDSYQLLAIAHNRVHYDKSEVAFNDNASKLAQEMVSFVSYTCKVERKKNCYVWRVWTAQWSKTAIRENVYPLK